MRKAELTFNLVFLFSPIFIAFGGLLTLDLVGNSPIQYFWLVVALYSIGIILLLKSKYSSLKSTNLFTFGCKNMVKVDKAAYLIGYFIIVLSCMINVGLIFFFFDG